MKKVIYLISALALSAVFFTSCKKDAKAGFTAPSTANVGDAVSMKDNETDRKNASFVYDFGDGSYSTDRNPSHVYTKAGTYHIYQTVTLNKNLEKGTGFSQVATADITISGPVANFTTDKTTAAINEPITFTNTSTGSNIYSWSWISSNGQNSSSWNGNQTEVKDMVFTFSDAGTYKVTLWANQLSYEGSNSNNATTKTVSITVTGGTGSSSNAVTKASLYGKWNYSSDTYTTGYAASPSGSVWATSAVITSQIPNPLIHTSLTFYEPTSPGGNSGSYNQVDAVGNQTTGTTGAWTISEDGKYLDFNDASSATNYGSLDGTTNNILTEFMIGGTYSLTVTATTLTLEINEKAVLPSISGETRSRKVVWTR